MIIIYLTTLFIKYVYIYIQTSRNKLPNSKCIIGYDEFRWVPWSHDVPWYPMISWVLNRPFLDRNMMEHDLPKKCDRKIVKLHYSHGDSHGSDLLWLIFWGMTSSKNHENTVDWSTNDQKINSVNWISALQLRSSTNQKMWFSLFKSMWFVYVCLINCWSWS